MDQILGKAGQGVLKLMIRNKKGYRPTCAEQYALSSSKGGHNYNHSINQSLSTNYTLPWTVVVHPNYTLFTSTTMMGFWWTIFATRRTWFPIIAF